jgi:hypothetical protein
MAAWKPWQLDTPYMSGPEVMAIKDRLWRLFQWVRDKYPQLAPAGRTDVYDEPVAAAVREYRFRRGWDATGAAPADWQVKVGLGIIKAAAAPAADLRTEFLSVTGTGGFWDNGFGFDVGVRLDPKRFRHQPVGYNTSAFLMGDPSHSFLDALNDGSAELLRLSLPNYGPKIWDGYSMGASVVTRALNLWPVDRQHEIVMVTQQGDPTRPKGKTLLGNDPGGEGISDERPPAWVLDRYFSFAISGDMYPAADGLLPQLYSILVRAEASPEFAMYLFQMFLTSAGGMLLGSIPGGNLLGSGALSGLLGLITPGPVSQTTGPPNLFAMILNIGGIVQTLMTALKFVITNAHSHYGDQRVFDGLTGVDKAVQLIQAA